MLYFFILPVYLVFFAIIFIISIVLIFRPSLKRYGIYGLGVSIGSIPGFIIANTLLWLGTLCLLYVHFPDWLQSLQKFLIAGLAFLGPIPMSVIGIIAGSIIGVYIVHRRRNSSKGLAGKD
ncbi:MAG TPA: hypothetical protein PL110_00015 [Candidatus Eremiobacteraeota bacterium]|nr:MAG: hypothetical protein BWY64_00253 [bacterium ADurb.Bin363]HPZ06469.1 hypothetical protein [Candidatus Eremiobacteraeota bacterium]